MIQLAMVDRNLEVLGMEFCQHAICSVFPCQGSRSSESIKKQFIDFVFKQSFQLPSIQELKYHTHACTHTHKQTYMQLHMVFCRLRDFLELKKTASSLAILFEPENGDYTRMVNNFV